MQNAKPILDKSLSADDYHAFAEAIANAYKACDNFFRSNVVTDNFITGMQHRSVLINAFAEHALTKIAEERGIYFESCLNHAKNHWHTRFFKDKLTITTHFLGRNGDRSKARSANYRALLASRNFDLFENELTDQNTNSKNIYCHLLHSGFIRPEEICLALPTTDQTQISHSMPLSIPEPVVTQGEMIREEMTLKLLSVEEIHDESKEAS